MEKSARRRSSTGSRKVRRRSVLGESTNRHNNAADDAEADSDGDLCHKTDPERGETWFARSTPSRRSTSGATSSSPCAAAPARACRRRWSRGSGPGVGRAQQVCVWTAPTQALVADKVDDLQGRYGEGWRNAGGRGDFAAAVAGLERWRRGDDGGVVFDYADAAASSSTSASTARHPCWPRSRPRRGAGAHDPGLPGVGGGAVVALSGTLSKFEVGSLLEALGLPPAPATLVIRTASPINSMVDIHGRRRRRRLRRDADDGAALVFAFRKSVVETLGDHLATQFPERDVVKIRGNLAMDEKRSRLRRLKAPLSETGYGAVGVVNEAGHRGLDHPDLRTIIVMEPPSGVKSWLQLVGAARAPPERHGRRPSCPEPDLLSDDPHALRAEIEHLQKKLAAEKTKGLASTHTETFDKGVRECDILFGKELESLLSGARRRACSNAFKMLRKFKGTKLALLAAGAPSTLLEKATGSYEFWAAKAGRIGRKDMKAKIGTLRHVAGLVDNACVTARAKFGGSDRSSASMTHFTVRVLLRIQLAAAGGLYDDAMPKTPKPVVGIHTGAKDYGRVFMPFERDGQRVEIEFRPVETLSKLMRGVPDLAFRRASSLDFRSRTHDARALFVYGLADCLATLENMDMLPVIRGSRLLPKGVKLEAIATLDKLMRHSIDKVTPGHKEAAEIKVLPASQHNELTTDGAARIFMDLLPIQTPASFGISDGVDRGKKQIDTLKDRAARRRVAAAKVQLRVRRRVADDRRPAHAPVDAGRRRVAAARADALDDGDAFDDGDPGDAFDRRDRRDPGGDGDDGDPATRRPRRRGAPSSSTPDGPADEAVFLRLLRDEGLSDCALISPATSKGLVMTCSDGLTVSRTWAGRGRARGLTGVTTSSAEAGQNVRKKVHHERIQCLAAVKELVSAMLRGDAFAPRRRAPVEGGTIKQADFVALLASLQWRHWLFANVAETISTPAMLANNKPNYGILFLELPFLSRMRSLAQSLGFWRSAMTVTTRGVEKSGKPSGEVHEGIVQASQQRLGSQNFGSTTRLHEGRAETNRGLTGSARRPPR
ncbi:hypothetical protein JL722_11560 [Aureococcus anophagefferens]|nr:hypothetical protein JL722_11560 [Aureococcus anophagefferens]